MAKEARDRRRLELSIGVNAKHRMKVERMLRASPTESAEWPGVYRTLREDCSRAIIPL